MRAWRAETVRPRGVAENAAALADRGLIVAMRCQDRGALAEFYRRFRPVLVVAVRRLTSDAIDGEALVEDVLTDAAVYFVTSTKPAPMSVAGYLVRMLRNRVLNAVRARDRRERREDASAPLHEAPATTPAAPLEPSPAVARLAEALDAAMTDDDRLVAAWLGNGVSQQQIAEWLGLTYAALCKRVSRMRTRLRVVAERYIAAASAEDRHALAALLRGRGTPDE